MKIIGDDGVEREIKSLEELDEFKTLKQENVTLAEEKEKLQKIDRDFGKFQKKTDDEIAKMNTNQLQAYREKELAEERAKGLESKITEIETRNKQFVVNSTLQQFGLSTEQVELVRKNMAIISNDTERGINEETPEGIFKKVELAVNMLGVPKQDFSTAGSYGSMQAFSAPAPKAFIDTEEGKKVNEEFWKLAGKEDPEALKV